METRIIDIPLFGGIDTKTEQKLVDTNKSLVLENAVVKNMGEIVKRNGYELIADGTTCNRDNNPDDQLKAANSIHSYENTLITIGTDGKINGEGQYNGPGAFSFGPDFNKHMFCGNYDPITFDVEYIYQPANTNSQASHAEGNNLRLFVFEQDGESFAETVGNNSNISFTNSVTSFDRDGQGTSATQSPQVVYLEDGDGNKKFLALAPGDPANGTANSLAGKFYDATNPTDSGTYYEVCIGDMNASNIWDMDKIDFPTHTNAGVTIDGYSEALIAFEDGAGQYAIKSIKTDGSWISYTSVITAGLVKNGICIKYINDSVNGERIFVIYQNASDSKIYGAAFDPILNQVVAETVLTTALTAKDIRSITLASHPAAGSGMMRLFIEVTANKEEDYYVYSFDISFDLATVGSSTASYNCGLVSKAFTYGNYAYALILHETRIQPTYFLISPRGQYYTVPVAKVFYGRAGKLRKQGLANIIQKSASVFSIACTIRSRILSNYLGDYQIACINFDMNPPALPSVQLGKTLVIGGAMVAGFDGQIQELGFNVHPENIFLTGPYTTGGFMDDGYRSYKGVYTWVDRNGDLYRSAPSEAIGRTYSAGTSTQNDYASVPGLSMSDPFNKTNGNQISNVEFYRTIDNGSIYYLLAKSIQQNAVLFTSVSTTTAGSESDEDLEDNEILYTQGGALPNIGPPASNILAASMDRIFLVPMDDPQSIWFSKKKVSGIGIEFAEELQLRIEKGGPNTGLSVLDDKVIIFKEREIYYISGDGPNDYNQGIFSGPNQISTDVGCVNHASIANIGIGIIFKSQKGIYLLDRSLNTIYIGAPVEKFNKYSVVACTLLEDINQARLVLSHGQGVLCYDYLHNQWSRFTNHPAKDAVVHNGTYYWLKDDGIIRKENNGFTDGNFAIPLKVRTSWIKLSGIQGFQRIRKASIIGDLRSATRITVNVFIDYDDVNPVQTISFDSTNVSGNEPLQFQIHLKRQKCQSIMFEITDAKIPGSGVTQLNVALTGIALECGVKRGLVKKPKRKTK